MLRRSKIVITGFALCLLAIESSAQIFGDFPYDRFIAMVMQYHPQTELANILNQSADASLMLARSRFDPDLGFSNYEKFYSGTHYYNTSGGVLDWKSPSPFSLSGGYDLNSGVYLDPATYTPKDGLIFAGAGVSLLQGLMTDASRTALRQAKAMQRQNEALSKNELNTLRLSATATYWQWWQRQRVLDLAMELDTISRLRFEAIRARAIAGDRPMIDTVEARAQWQLRTLQLLEARQNERKSRQLVASFLWDPALSNLPLDGMILSAARCSDPTREDVAAFLLINKPVERELAALHPLIVAADFKIRQIELDQRWKREKLKPKLDLKYQFLTTPATSDATTGFSLQNYRWGMKFSMPIFLREGRAEVRLASLKLREAQLERQLKENEIGNKLVEIRNNLSLALEQWQLAERNRELYLRLLDAERIRLLAGESSVFLVNVRESAYADAAIKNVETALKARVQFAEYEYYLGR
ncbi:MAG: TolC family protein [Flavobacteriales bacterium]